MARARIYYIASVAAAVGARLYLDTGPMLFPELHIAGLCVYVYLLAAASGARLEQHGPLAERASAMYHVYIQHAVVAILLPSVRALHLWMVFTWLFSFPSILEVDAVVHRAPLRPGTVAVCSVTMAAYAVFVVAGGLAVLLCAVTAAVAYALLWPRRPMVAIWTAYGAVGAAWAAGVITESAAYVAYLALNVFSKAFATFQCQLIRAKPFTVSYRIRRVFGQLAGHVAAAAAARLLTLQEQAHLTAYLDTRDDNADAVAHEELRELYPTREAVVHTSLCVAFIDIVGYSTFVRDHTLQETVAYVDDYYTRLDTLASTHGITKVETIGDAYMAVSADADALVGFCMAVMGVYKERVRAGIHVGDVVACAPGLSRARYAYIGHAVNVAARLESTGVPGRVQVSADVAERLRRWTCVGREGGPVVLKGIGVWPTWFVADTES